MGKTDAHLIVDGDQTREVRVLVFAPKDAPLPASTDIVFTVKDLASGTAASHKDFFKAP